MKYVIAIVLALISMSFCGTVTGYFTFLCEEPPSEAMSYVIVAPLSVFATGDFYSVPYTSPDASWDFSLTADFSDEEEYYAVGMVLTYIGSGIPMGIYPESPFHTNDGEAADIEITLDDTVNSFFMVNPADITFENIYLSFYDAISMYYTGGDSILEKTVPLIDTFELVENIPSGIKFVCAFKDINDNAMWEDGEPIAFAETPESNLVIIAGGVSDTVYIDFATGGINEYYTLELRPRLHIHPSPFNNAMIIDIEIHDKRQSTLQIIDIAGEIVFSRKIDDEKHIVWEPDNISTGLYLVRLTTMGTSIVKRVVYIR